jgi:hypothetical protein
MDQLLGSFYAVKCNTKEEFIKTLDKHDRELARVRERYDGEQNRERVRAAYEEGSLMPRRKVGVGNNRSSGTHESQDIGGE